MDEETAHELSKRAGAFIADVIKSTGVDKSGDIARLQLACNEYMQSMASDEGDPWGEDVELVSTEQIKEQFESDYQPIREKYRAFVERRGDRLKSCWGDEYEKLLLTSSGTTDGLVYLSAFIQAFCEKMVESGVVAQPDDPTESLDCHENNVIERLWRVVCDFQPGSKPDGAREELANLMLRFPSMTFMFLCGMLSQSLMLLTVVEQRGVPVPVEVAHMCNQAALLRSHLIDLDEMRMHLLGVDSEQQKEMLVGGFSK